MDKLRSYQQEAIDHIVKQHRVLLGDEQGLGKTVVSLTSAIKLCADKPQILVFVPKVATGTWVREAKKWFGGDAIVYTGSSKPRERDALWDKYQKEKPLLLVVTYAMVEEILARQVGWQCIIADEYHKAGLMNHKTKTFKSFKKLRSRFLILLSGTPVKRGPQNLFAPLHLVNSYKFSSYWKFVNKYCVVIKDTFGYTIEPRPKNPSEFRNTIAPYVIRRTKKKVLKDLPPLQRQPIYLELDNEQKFIYNQLVEQGMAWDSTGVRVACPNEATKIMRLRQLLVSPRLLGIQHNGAAIDALLDLVEDSFPVAICTPFRAGVDLIADALKSRITQVYKIYGQMKVPATQIADMFQKDPSKEKAIVYTISSGMSWDAYAASNVFFVGAEWSSVDNKQAEARLHRLGQLKAVNAYYLLYPGTIDDQILERLDENTMAQNWTLNIDDMLSRLKKV